VTSGIARRVVTLVLSAALAGCCGSAGRVRSLPEVRDALLDYYASGCWEADVARVTRAATRRLAKRLPEVVRPALVLDVDECALSTIDYQRVYGFAYVPDEWHRWVDKASFPAVPPVLDLYRFARERGAAIFFVTARRESTRLATEENLRAAGYPAWEGLLMRPESDRADSVAGFKTASRAWVEQQGYRVVANIGDQESDHVGGHSEAFFKLPNPFYRVP